MAPQSMNMAPRQDLMPPEMAGAGGMPPEAAAVYEQMRQTISPKEFSDEMLAGAEQIDPEAVAQFKQQLEALSLPPEVLDALNDMVDEILANPENYEETRQEFIKAGVPEDVLPEQFDPEFFAAFNMAIDQMIAAPAGPQAFAKGGIAELKPIAKAIASYGRNGDTMLAHITPAEARMLRRRGGSGTTNPHTGLPEFFLKKIVKAVGKVFKSVGKAISGVVKGVVNTVKKFASSTIGKIITTVALGFFLGPAAANFLGVSSAAGVAAVSGFVGSAGATLAGGGSLRDALKAGAVGGLTAGAGSVVMGGTSALASGSYTGPTTIAGRFDQLKDMVSPSAAPGIDATAAEGSLAKVATPGEAVGQATGAAAPPPVLTPETVSAAPGATAPVSGPQFEGYPATQAPSNYTQALADTVAREPGAVAPGTSGPSYFDQAKDFYTKNISPSGIQEAGQQDAMAKVLKQFPTATAEQVMNAPASSVLGKAYQAAMPGMLSTYGPAVGLGIGALALSGGFTPKPVDRSAVPLIDVMEDRVAKENQMMQENPGMFSPQGFERYGATYNDKGQITSWAPWTPESAGAFTKPTVVEPTGPSYTVGGGSYLPAPMTGTPGIPIPQPYNTYSMYGNVLPPPQYASARQPMRRAAGGIANLAAGGYPRRNGQIEGPGTETSDDIPAMLSDGEFVMTAKAVRGAGNGSRRDGAKKMYALMHRLEKNATRG